MRSYAAGLLDVRCGWFSSGCRRRGALIRRGAAGCSMWVVLMWVVLMLGERRISFQEKIMQGKGSPMENGRLVRGGLLLVVAGYGGLGRVVMCRPSVPGGTSIGIGQRMK